MKLVLLDRIPSSSPRTVGGSDRLSCCRKVKSCFYVGPARDHPRDCHRVLTRAGKIQETRDVTWEAPPSRIPPRQSLLPIEEAGEGGEESDDDVEEAEVCPLVGRGVPHVRVQRRNGEVASGERGMKREAGAV